jgi:predicted RNA-binding protein YlxR (DUF448 family)
MIIRMCVVCRSRFLQSEMLRLQCQNNEIIKFSGIGRSFYICKSCINDKKLDKIIQKICKTNKDKIKQIVTTIKEM